MHFFLHDTEKIRHCLWDGNVSYADKEDIAKCLVDWLSSLNVSVGHLIYDHEDGTVFAQATNQTSSI